MPQGKPNNYMDISFALKISLKKETKPKKKNPQKTVKPPKNLEMFFSG